MQNHSPGRQFPRPARILCVEDDALLRELIQTTLERLGGFEVLACQDGEKALETLDRFQADLLLLDANLPGMDGPALLREYRQRCDPQEVSAVFLTGEMGEEAIERLQTMGAATVLLKPIAPALLVSKVKSALEAAVTPC